MRRLLKIVFIVLLLAWGTLGLRHSFARQEADSATTTLEIYETGDKTTPAPSRIAWVAEQTVTWVNDSEVEE
jgi:hypothetical protein